MSEFQWVNGSLYDWDETPDEEMKIAIENGDE